MPEPLDKIAREIRSAVLGGDHACAERLIAKYIEALREVWEALPEEARAASDIPKVARELLGWVHEMTVVQRAMAADQLAVIEKAWHYSVPLFVQPPSAGVQLRG